MSDKNKNENKNVIEKLLDSVITYSQSNMGPNEQILTQIATSPGCKRATCQSSACGSCDAGANTVGS